MSDTVVILCTSAPQTLVEVAQNRLDNVITAKKLAVERYDGCLPENKELRDKFFTLSAQRGKYPQVFLRKDDDSYTFVGLWEQVESLLECDSFPGLQPEQTFKGVFANAKRTE